jgi:plasmid stabilization system protein ParE
VTVIWSPLALECVAEIAAYIGEDRPEASERWVEETFEAVRRLSSFPLGGCIVPELNREHVREVFQGRFTVWRRLNFQFSRFVTPGNFLISMRLPRQNRPPDHVLKGDAGPSMISHTEVSGPAWRPLALSRQAQPEFLCRELVDGRVAG